MIVYVETNFVLELAYLQDEYKQCGEILALAENHKIELVVPAFSLGEIYESWMRRATRRKETHNTLERELNEIARSKPHRAKSAEFRKLTKMLVTSNQDEKQRLDDAASRLLNSATIIALTQAILQSSLTLQNDRNLSPQDAIVYASVLEHAAQKPSHRKCFITKNPKDFSNPDIESDLNLQTCKLLFSFTNGLRYTKRYMKTKT